MAMATAWLDQEFGWANGSRANEASTVPQSPAPKSSHRPTSIMQGTEYATEVTSPVTGPLAYLPAVISYEALAPAMYAPAPRAGQQPTSVNPLEAADDETGLLADGVLELAGACHPCRR